MVRRTRSGPLGLCPSQMRWVLLLAPAAAFIFVVVSYMDNMLTKLDGVSGSGDAAVPVVVPEPPLPPAKALVAKSPNVEPSAAKPAAASPGGAFLAQEPRLASAQQAAESREGKGQWVHWIFVTDCSAYMFNQGNMMLASAHYVNQPGNFTWIIVGCTTKQQKAQLEKLAHPRAKAWFAPDEPLVHPVTGKPYHHFQASNRPVAIGKWWRETKPSEEAIGILDPDEMFMRPVHLVHHPRPGPDGNPAKGNAWESQAARPKMGSGAMYGIGCVASRIAKSQLEKVCGQYAEQCVKMLSGDCQGKYSSGPPWILHRDDADNVFGTFVKTAIQVHEIWPDMLAEQGSYGITQMMFGITNHLDPFWFLSSPDDSFMQPWKQLLKVDWDPCEARAPPPINLSLPPLWHACSTFQLHGVPNNKAEEMFRLHKDHIPKDLLDCGTSLLLYPPTDSLRRWKGRNTRGFRDTWSLCTYTNLVNFHAGAWKKQYCDKPNLEPLFNYPPHSQGFVNPNAELKNIFRKGGWTDIDYKLDR